MRVWERGSGETLACGTGACASAVAACLNGLCDKGAEITVTLLGGDLKIVYTDELLMQSYIYDYRNELEKEENDNLSKWLREAREVLEKNLTAEQLKLKPLKEKISITIDTDLLNELKAEEEKDERSLSLSTVS